MKPDYHLYWRKAAIGVTLATSLIAPYRGLAQSPAPAGVNLFTNPGHEHPGAYFGGRGELNVTWNWIPFWEEPPTGADLRDPNYRTPEFRPTFARDYPYRVNSGGGADHWFNFYALNRAAGIMQVVEGLQVGQALRYTSWVSLWSSNDNDPAIPPSSSRDGNMQIRACIQQDGGPRNMLSKELVCSPWAQPYDKWHQISVDATAKNSKVLAFVQSRAAVPVQHNDAFVDDSCFEILPNHGAAGICLGQAYVPTGSSQGTRQSSAPIPPAPVAASERQNGSAYVNLPGFPSSVTGVSTATAIATPPTPTAAAANASPSVNTSGEVKANVPTLNVRRGPSFQSDIVGTISRDEGLPAIEQNGAWWKVSFKGEIAYVSAPLVSFAAAAKPSPVATASATPQASAPAAPTVGNSTGTIKPNVPVLNIRRGPGAQHAIVGTIETGDTLPATRQENGWWAVIYKGETAYVNATLVDFTATPITVIATTPRPTATPAPQAPVNIDINALGVVGVVYSKGQKLILLSEPNPSSSVMFEVENNVNLAVTGKANDDFWTVLYKGGKVYVDAAQVQFSGNTALITADMVAPAPAPQPANQGLGNAPGLPFGPQPPVTPAPIDTPTPVKPVLPPSGTQPATAGRLPQGVNIRSQPSTTAAIKQALQYGEVIEVTGRTDDGLWFEVRTASGPGYVFASLTVPNQAALDTPTIEVSP